MKYFTITDQDCTGEVDRDTWVRVQAVQSSAPGTHLRFNLRTEVIHPDALELGSEVISRYQRCSAWSQETPEYSPWVQIQSKRNK